jgi:hypothetical protein
MGQGISEFLLILYTGNFNNWSDKWEKIELFQVSTRYDTVPFVSKIFLLIISVVEGANAAVALYGPDSNKTMRLLVALATAAMNNTLSTLNSTFQLWTFGNKYW